MLAWYERNQRPLPWRESKDPYVIWLSEIILQQTRVQQGLPYFERFRARYPTVKDLAAAPLDEVLRLWEGLGYYSRARNMHRAARQVVYEGKGVFPANAEELQKLPGVGPYTARAIASMAFEEPVAVLDGNVFRVISRLEADARPVNKPAHRAHFQELTEKRLDRERPGAFNQALMELGALVCTPRQPDCGQCPVRSHCQAFQRGEQEQFPVKEGRKAKEERFLHYLFLRRKGRVAVQQRQFGIWQGLYQFPLVEASGPLRAAELAPRAEKEGLLPQACYLQAEGSVLAPHALTHQRLHLRVFEVALPADLAWQGEELEWVPAGHLGHLAFPRPLRRWLDEKQLILPFPK